jgi:hypothetical protein
MVSAFVDSGLSQKAFCQREDLALSTFLFWKRRLASHEGGEVAPDPEPSVIDLGALEDRPAGWEVEIALGDGGSLTLRRR